MAAAEIVQTQGPRLWQNYHKTGTAELDARFALRSGDSGRGRDELAEAAGAVRAWLAAAQQAGAAVRAVGGAWSPSNIQIVAPGGWMLNTRRFNRCFRLAAADFAAPASVDSSAFLLVEAGVQIDEINDKLEADKADGGVERSLRSTGASNGQTLAGACATGTHGSVLEAGGLQDHVRAIQIVTPGGVHWIEPAAGLMSNAFIADTGSAPLRDDDAFAAALVAVGALGIVTAMVIETVPRYLLRPIFRLIDFTREDLEGLARGDYRAFSAKHGLDRDPYFLMVITNPYRPFSGKAVVRMLYREPYTPGYKRAEPAELGAGYDAFSMLGWIFRTFPWAPRLLIPLIMRLGVGKGTAPDDPPVYASWGETTETHKPMADLFTGAIFCDRADVVRTFDSLCKAFTSAGGATAVTLRFMSGGPGLLAPARWQHTAGVDCDGPAGKRTEFAFRAVLEALDKEGIPFTRHWGKYNELDAARVGQDYGADLGRWKAVQSRLLPGPADLRLFAAPALDRLGLTR